MSVRRVQGSEVEYGIIVQGQPSANPMVASTHVVNSYAAANGLTRRAQWDFEEETPLRDARGFDMSREHADPSQLTDEDLGLANIILTNGARLYVDHAHPEYSSPECLSPRDVLLWEKAGEIVMRRGAELASRLGGQPEIVLYKNNIDNKGASYGSHENYLMKRSVPFSRIVDHLTPFFASRQVMCGAGRVGRRQDGSRQGFQISQRADYFEVQVGLETTLKRPIINTRDEPHADPAKYRRLHVIIGDANLSDTSLLLKQGTAALVLDMIEKDTLPAPLELVDPVRALHEISYDASLHQTVELVDGRSLTGLEIQGIYLQAALDHTARHGMDDETKEILALWERVLEQLSRDPMELADELDWVAKLALLERYRERDGLEWDDPKLHLIDLQYHDIRIHKGLFHKLVASGRMKTLLDTSAIDRAVTEPPTDTRAYFRGKCLAKFAPDIAAASWDSVIFDLPGSEALQRVPTLDPLRGTETHVGTLFEEHDTAQSLFNAITGH